MPINIQEALADAIRSRLKIEGVIWAGDISEATSLGDATKILIDLDLNFDEVLATAGLKLAKSRLQLPQRTHRDELNFVASDLRPAAELAFIPTEADGWNLDPDTIRRAVVACNLSIEIVHDLAIANNVPLFELLGMRNLSSFLGEMFAREMRTLMPEQLIANPNQDGYPDLCARTDAGRTYIELRMSRGETSVKEFWSPFPHGGVEVKATCGNTPPAKTIAKPKIGDSRYPILKSAEWKAHHRDTNNLVALYWDFIDGLPTVLAVFFRNDLTTQDWGEIVQPKPGGGRTTSVSIMTRPGVEKMAQGWVVLTTDDAILNRLTQARVFPLTPDQVDGRCSIKGILTQR